LVYCYSSGFWQHFDGHELGQQQQQHKNGADKIKTISPSTKGPIYIPKLDWTVGKLVVNPVIIPSVLLTILDIKSFLKIIIYKITQKYPLKL